MKVEMGCSLLRKCIGRTSPSSPYCFVCFMHPLLALGTAIGAGRARGRGVTPGGSNAMEGAEAAAWHRAAVAMGALAARAIAARIACRFDYYSASSAITGA